MAEEKVKLSLFVDDMMFYISFIYLFILVVLGLSCGR